MKTKSQIEVRLVDYRMQSNEIVRKLKVPRLMYDYAESLRLELSALLEKQHELEWVISK